MVAENNPAGRLEGKVAVVTGGASGIGEAAVRTFVANGAKVVIVDIQDAAGLELVQDLGGNEVARYVHCDVTSEEQLAAALDSTVADFGGLDILYNNAGILGICGPIEETSGDDWDLTVRILVKAYFLGIKHATRIMRAANKGGSIINTASVASTAGGYGPHCYTTCKHAVVGLTKSAAAELRSYQIRVNAVSPTGVLTPLALKTVFSLTDDQYAANASNALATGESGLRSTLATVQDIANAALFLASDDSKYVSGQNLVVDGSYLSAPQTEHLPIFFGKTCMVSTSVKSDYTSFLK